MAIIIFNMAKRAFINHSLVFLETFALLALIGQIGRGTIFNAFNNLPRLGFKFINMNAVKPSLF